MGRAANTSNPPPAPASSTRLALSSRAAIGERNRSPLPLLVVIGAIAVSLVASVRAPSRCLLQRLPELYPVAVAVLDPGEATVAFVHAIRVDPDPRGREVCQESVEVVHAVV